MSDGPRSVKIDPNERGAWTSDRPRREGQEERPRRVDISVRCRLLPPSDRIRYSPGSLVLVTGIDEGAVEGFAERAFEEQNAVLTLGKLRRLVAGKVSEDEVEAKVAELRQAVAAKRLARGESVVVALPELDAGQRDHWARMAAAHRRPRHVIFIDTKTEGHDDEVVAAANAFRRAVTDAELGAEGFFTVMRLGGSAVGERRRVVFAPPPAND